MNLRRIALGFALAALLALGGAAPAPDLPLGPRLRWVMASLEASAGSPGAVPVVPAGFEASVRLPGTEPGAAPLGTDTAAGGPAIRVLVRTEDPAALREAGFPPGTVAGEVATAEVPLSRLRELAAVRGVRNVALSLPVFPSLDVSARDIRADVAHGSEQPPYPATGATGRGVYVGVVDSGLDLTHPDFQNDDGTTRVTAAWDQTDEVGPRPNGYNYGTEWSRTAIDAGGTRFQDLAGHGTHVTGIAAGNGRATGNGVPAYTYTGIAPEAKLLVVKTRFDEASVLDGVNWILQRASGTPCAINLSLGNQFGPHDGSGDMDRALRYFSGPGRIVVAAAGNEGDARIHASGTVPAGGQTAFTLRVGAYVPQAGSQNDVVNLEAWYPRSGNLTFKVTTPGGTTVGPYPVGGIEGSGTNTPDGRVYVTHAIDPVSGDKYCYVDIFDGTADNPPVAGDWVVTAANAGGSATPVDLWTAQARLQFQSGEAAVWVDHLDPSDVVSSPATSDSVIAVGCYVTKLQWESLDGKSYQYTTPGYQIGGITSFSSRGPRRDGVLKPEISAPGLGVASARSTQVLAGEFKDIRYAVTDGRHVISQGTSQAAPHVTGTAALILEKFPRAARAEVLDRLTRSARSDAFTGATPNPTYGYGKVDAAEAVAGEAPGGLLSVGVAWAGSDATVSWSRNDAEPALRYVIERGASSGGPFAAAGDTLEAAAVLIAAGPPATYAWVDPSPDPDRPWYRVIGLSRTGESYVFGPVRLVSRVLLFQNFPNPFPGGDAGKYTRTTVAFDLDRTRTVELAVYDLRGRRVAVLASGSFPPGHHEKTWDGSDGHGRQAPAGVYFYRLRAGDEVQTRRMVLIR